MARYRKRNPIRAHIRRIVCVCIVLLAVLTALIFLDKPFFKNSPEEGDAPVAEDDANTLRGPDSYGESRPEAVRPVNSRDEEELTDHLSSGDEVKFYALEMAEYGDAVISVTGLQEAWDGYVYHWRCTVYEEDRETAIASVKVRGYSVNDGPAILPVKLDAGTYYIEMTHASSGNPFMTSFTTAPYTIHIDRYYASNLPIYSDKEIQTFYSAMDVLWAFDGTGFIKLNDGECFGALMTTKAGAVVPVLISTEKTAVEYVVTTTGEYISASGPWHHDDSGIDYYYSACDGIAGYSESDPDTSSFPILLLATKSSRTAVERMADKLFKEELGESKYWRLKNKGAMIGAIVLIVAVLLIVFGKKGGGGSRGGPDIDGTGSIMEMISAWWADGV